MNLENKTALCWDGGMFVPFAQALARTGFGRVLYFSPYQFFEPKSRDASVGSGLPDIERVDSFFDHLKDADVLVFPDVGSSDLQMHLRADGYKVWGTGRAETLEVNRIALRKLLEKMGMPVIPYEILVGVDELGGFMQDSDNDDTWIKGSFYRGDFESFHHESWWLSQPWLRDLEHRLGPRAEDTEFVAEQGVKAIEPGYDGPYCIGGEFPRRAMWGWEQKDRGYVGRVSDGDLPTVFAEVNEKLGPLLDSLNCQGNLHYEVRIAEDDTVYLTDPCTRLGSPPSECMGLNIKNWAEIVYHGARGQAVEPEYEKPYAAQIILTSPWAKEHFLAVDIPAKIRDRVVLNRPIRYGDFLYHAPAPTLEFDKAGSAIGLGDTPEEAIDEALKVAEQVKGYQLEYDTDAKKQLLGLVKEGRSRGLAF